MFQHLKFWQPNTFWGRGNVFALDNQLKYKNETIQGGFETICEKSKEGKLISFEYIYIF